MHSIRLQVIFLLGSLLVFNLFTSSKCDCDMNKFKESGIVPNIVSEVPPEELKLLYPDKPVACGEDINITLTANAPLINYTAVNTEFYALVMIDPDAPDPHRPVYAQFLHWFVVNIPGNKVELGKVLMQYMQPSPPPYSAPHRYVFVVFHQPSYMHSPSYMDGRRRSRFDINDMLKKTKMDGIVAGNFFHTHNLRKK